jgi:hypothetical protein
VEDSQKRHAIEARRVPTRHAPPLRSSGVTVNTWSQALTSATTTLAALGILVTVSLTVFWIHRHINRTE